MKIYLAGSIPKGDKEAGNFYNWREYYEKVLSKALDAECIIPKTNGTDETDFMAVVGRDSNSINISDLIIINAEERIGAGTSMEMVIAKYLKKPVVTVLPKDTYHRRSNVVFDGALLEDWVHPFIGAFSDFIVEKVEDIPVLKESIKTTPIKDISLVDLAIDLVNSRHN